MKLKSDFITQMIEDVQFLLSVAGRHFNGIIRSNETAAFIVDQLKEETTEAAIVDALLREYDAERETVEKDVARIVELLRKNNVLEE